jgi:ankyrin repeat protein
MDSREEEEEDGAMSITKKPIVPPLHAAAREGDLESLSKLLASHSSPTNNNNNNNNHIINERDMHGRTAIHLASWANEKAIVERLLDFGADVTVGAADGVQAIHFACMKGHLGIVKTLLSRERTNRYIKKNRCLMVAEDINNNSFNSCVLFSIISPPAPPRDSSG